MSGSEDKSQQLLESFLSMSETEREGVLLRLDFDQLRVLIESFTAELNQSIKTMPRRPDTTKAKKLLTRFQGDAEENG